MLRYVSLLALLISVCLSVPAWAAQTTAATAPAKIAEFQGPYRFLSNFWPAEVEFEGLKYPTVEHAYQSAKTLDANERKRIAALPTPAEAKAAGRALKLRDDWEQVKFDVMEKCVRYKLMHHDDLRQMLLDTGDATLEEGNTWGDRIWGVYQGQGENRLGKILMKVRSELRERPATTQAANGSFHEQELRKSLESIRPGKPGLAPFWNQNAHQFMAAPAFDFTAVEGGAKYHFSIECSDGQTRQFDAPEAWAPLTPMWAQVPPGTTRVRVEAIDADGKTISVAGERTFHRAAIFNGPYGKPAIAYDESVRIALDGLIHEPFVQSWLTTGKPDPEYKLYRYAAKIGGAVMTASAMYARQSPRPKDADEALEIGRRAADYLISISAAAGSPLEFFPPTYHDAPPTERENDNWTMLMTPAEAGEGYLDLYEATHDVRYLAAADRIAHTYGKTQLASGTWHLKVDNRTGEPLAPIDLIPSEVINFLDRIITHYQKPEHQPTLDRAVEWMMANPVRTMNWQAQFDDAKMRGAYQNLSKHEACQFAMYLLTRKDHDEKKIALGEELLRFAEDQFVTWENPPQDLKLRGKNLDPQNWFTPCSLEQYAMFEPISGSSAWMIMTYLRAYDVTGKAIYLAKAESLANALTAAQEYHHGRYPTRMVRQDQAYWINSSMNTIRAMSLLAEHERARP